MGRKRRVSGGTSQVLALFVGDVVLVGVHVVLGEPKINDVDVVFSSFGSAGHKVVGLDVAVNNAVFVAFLNSINLSTQKSVINK